MSEKSNGIGFRRESSKPTRIRNTRRNLWFYKVLGRIREVECPSKRGSEIQSTWIWVQPIHTAQNKGSADAPELGNPKRLDFRQERQQNAIFDGIKAA